MPGQQGRAHALGVRVHSAAGVEASTKWILACHSDQALALLADADPVEREVLGAIRYQSNEGGAAYRCVVAAAQPQGVGGLERARTRDRAAPCTVSYCMNLLQGLPGDIPW
jgi:predicted NAD/FAD-binding protein